jgi:hypothetical protein
VGVCRRSRGWSTGARHVTIHSRTPHAYRGKLEIGEPIFHPTQAPPAECGKSHPRRQVFHEMHAPGRRRDGLSLPFQWSDPLT